MRVEMIKCKEHFIDCANHRTFDITNCCDKVGVIMPFLVLDYKNKEIKCPLEVRFDKFIMLNKNVYTRVDIS